MAVGWTRQMPPNTAVDRTELKPPNTAKDRNKTAKYGGEINNNNY